MGVGTKRRTPNRGSYRYHVLAVRFLTSCSAAGNHVEQFIRIANQMGNPASSRLSLAVASLVIAVQSFAQMPTGPRYRTITLHSTVFNNTRSLRVWLPKNYDDPANLKKRYPVLYLNDGVMTFAQKGVNIATIVDGLVEKGEIPPIIVVGIDNGACTDKTTNQEVDRAYEFLPYPDTGFGPDNTYQPAPPDPHGKLYPRFLTEDVFPVVNQTLRTMTGAEFTAIGGYSYGATSALYCAAMMPKTFGMVLLESAPLWIGPNGELLNDCNKCHQWPPHVRIGLGTAEGESNTAISMKGVELTKQLISSIRANDPQCDLSFVLEEGAHHGPVDWGRRMPEDLKALFKARS